MIGACARQVLFAILLAALGIAQAQMSFPDISQAAVAIERVFGTIDRKPAMDMGGGEGVGPGCCFVFKRVPSEERLQPECSMTACHHDACAFLQHHQQSQGRSFHAMKLVPGTGRLLALTLMTPCVVLTAHFMCACKTR